MLKSTVAGLIVVTLASAVSSAPAATLPSTATAVPAVVALDWMAQGKC
jgi:hypothetical protein